MVRTWGTLLAVLSITGTTWATAGTTPAKAAPAPARPAAAPADGFACEMSVRSTAYGLVDTSKLWMRGSNFRWEKKTGAGLRILLLRNKKGIYQINQASNDGHKWPKEWERDLPPNVNLVGGPQGDPKLFLKKTKAVRTGEERLDGRPCYIYTYKSIPNKKGQRQIFRLWIAKIGGQPLKMETRSPNARGGYDLTAIEYRAYRWGLALDESFFDVPRGAKIGKVNLNVKLPDLKK